MRKSTARLVHYSLDHPRSIIAAMITSTVLLLLLALLPTLSADRFPYLHPVSIDTDPENMLPADEPVRVAHNASKKQFSLHDGIVVGIVNETHPRGVFNVSTLTKVDEITRFAMELEGVVEVDVMSLSTVDSISQAGPGTVRFQWLMAKPPADQAEADDIRSRAMRIPFLRDTLFSADGKALALYIPLRNKNDAHEISVALQSKIDAIGSGDDGFHIAGLPVAEDTFGSEMFIQMAIAAPAAMLVIFLLMWFFFGNLLVILSPMIVAVIAALSTMGLLIVTGNTIHIMSSMIPIFIMPIAVLDAIHIISDFFDRYQHYRDRRKTLVKVLGDLFQPMLFTSLTTTAGFASLALTPIPPVQIFGLFVGFGVLLAWFWTITFIPSFLMLIPEARLEKFGRKERTGDGDSHDDGVALFLARSTSRGAPLIIAGAVLLTAIAFLGISKIEVNDNPTRWFEPDHPIRIADRTMNSHFGGTYNAYLSLKYSPPPYDPDSFAEGLAEKAQRMEEALSAAAEAVQQHLNSLDRGTTLDLLDEIDRFVRQRRLSSESAPKRGAWTTLEGWLDWAFASAEDDETPPADGRSELKETLASAAAEMREASSRYRSIVEEVAGQAPETSDDFLAALSLEIETISTSEDRWRVVGTMLSSVQQEKQAFKDPLLLGWVSELQEFIGQHPVVGKSNSLADIVKTVHRDLTSGSEVDYLIPSHRDTVAQTLEQFLSGHRKDDLWHFVTPSFEEAMVWVQLKSGDNRDMQDVVAHLSGYLEGHPPPVDLDEPQWFGLTYINVVWQQKMVSGMIDAFLGSFIVVLTMMTFLFRSISWGILSMLPLTITVALIYGMIGLLGKDYDMPVAVLSSLSLGLAIDYAIHFLARARQLHRELGDWDRAREAVFGEPARAIGRNIIVVGLGFLPLILAPLVPYQTVGYLIASILLLAGGVSLVLLPALMTIGQRWFFAGDADGSGVPEEAPAGSKE